MASQRKQKYSFRISSLALAIQMVCVGAAHLTVVQSAYAQSNQAQAYSIPAGSLASVLNRFVAESGATLAMDAKQLEGQYSLGLTGQYSVATGFQQILAETAFRAVKAGNGYVLQAKPIENSPKTTAAAGLATQTATSNLPAESATVEMNVITVYGNKDRDSQGHDDVYDKNQSSVYAGKEYIERYKGATASDLLKGMANVYSGDARNSGALDPNIRGMQGQGRVPVTIDGTEQSLTVWRGYNGANSRSYIDPNLISSIQVVKGSSLDSDVRTGIAGGVAATTLEANDIVRPGEKYGAEIKLEGANNTVKEQKTNSYAGQDYRDVVEDLGLGKWTYNPFNNPLSNVDPHTSHDNQWHNLQDKAFRVAVATKQEDFDLLAAYAYRSRGNYFAGKSGKGFYDNTVASTGISVADLVSGMAKIYKPGEEVTNTSSESESYLLKGKWRFADDQSLSASYRKTNLIYGEIMPSRIWFYDSGLPQWPLSNIDTKAYNLEYEWNPEDNRWINFKANLWQTDTDSNTYTSGGFPNYIDAQDNVFNQNQDLDGDGIRDRLPGISGLIYDTANSVAKNTRKGVSLSNKIELLDDLSLMVAADLSREKLTTEDIDLGLYNGTGWRMLPRAGRRSEHEYKFNFNWQPTSWLSLSAGARSISYWSFDDYLNNKTGGNNTIYKDTYRPISVTADNEVEYTQSNYDKDYAYYTDQIERTSSALFKRLFAQRRDELKDKLGTIVIVTTTDNYEWHATEDGKYLKENNPLLNGEVDTSGKNITNIIYSSPKMAAINEDVKKKKDHKNWAPAFSAAIQLNNNNRIYANYTEAYRMPSLFETTLGFSASPTGVELKPEHAKNFEIGYVYNLKDLLKLKDGYADIKFSYFNNKTEDVIERDYVLKMTNMDLQKISGYELQGRFDNGKFFSDISLVYNKNNKVCDESSALINYLEGNGHLKGDICVQYGFSGGYLVNMALPEWQANLNLGARLLDDKLELGTRLNYFKGFDNPYANDKATSWLNAPLQWDSTLTFDAYSHYQYSENLGFDLIGTNLSNRYYLDPVSRSAVPAPGRAIKLGVNYKF